MTKQPDCPYFHGDYFRGRAKEECRLLERSGYGEQWTINLCSSCPVPGIVRDTTCNHLALEAEIVRKFGLFPRVSVFAICTDSLQSLPDPRHCPGCEEQTAMPPAERE
ncbi:MAG: hypothetical protein M5U01_04155 [Ardenticatenaceae bacterium]|nr:hypothetical protein [Ardenticatenaceae bacterium]HBY98580.1 hypothetical protein [Chloroflexota bacterium]